MRDSNNKELVIDGPWSLKVDNGGNGGASARIYFTAGPNHEMDGLFGRIDSN
jgi:hypothetical protein